MNSTDTTMGIMAERLIPIRDVPRLLPARPNGKRIHISACYRWVLRGIRGVKLEAVRIGGTTYTSQEALARFAAALSAGTESPPIAGEPCGATRRRQIEQATARVKALLS